MENLSKKTNVMQSMFIWLMCLSIFLNVIYKLKSGFSTMQPTNNTKIGSDNNSSHLLANLIEFWDGKLFAGAENYIQYSSKRFYSDSTINKGKSLPLILNKCSLTSTYKCKSKVHYQLFNCSLNYKLKRYRKMVMFFLLARALSSEMVLMT